MTYLGIALLLFGCIMAIRAYKGYLMGEVRLIEGFVAFLREMNMHTSSYLEPVSGWVGGFECPPLEEIGFLSELREGKMPKEAYRGLKKRPSSAEVDRLLLGFFDRTGLGYLKQEEAIERDCLTELSRLCEIERGEVERRGRVFGAVAFALVACVTLLLI